MSFSEPHPPREKEPGTRLAGSTNTKVVSGPLGPRPSVTGYSNGIGAARRPDQRHASITSNPSRASQPPPPRHDEHDDYFAEEGSRELPGPASPDSFPHATGLLPMGADTPQHDSSLDDFLTTESSSDNLFSEHTTPQELIWEQQFVLQDAGHPHVFDAYGFHHYEPASSASTAADLQGMIAHPDDALPKFVAGHELFGPTVGSTIVMPSAQSSPVAPVPRQPGDSGDSYAWSTNDPHHAPKPHTLQVDTTPSLTPSPHRQNGTRQHSSPNLRAPSPVVMVSSYDAQHAGSNGALNPSSKRTRDDDDGTPPDDHDSPDVQGSESWAPQGSSSRLVPPAPSDGGDDRPSNVGQRSGLEPQVRDESVIMSLKDLEEQRQRDERNADVQTWLATSDAGSDSDPDGAVKPSRRPTQGGRRRARSRGGQVDPLGPVYPDTHIPGPGMLVDVETDDEYFDDESASLSSAELEERTAEALGAYQTSGSPRLSPTALDDRATQDVTSFPGLDEPLAPEFQDPLPRQFYRRQPWQDPLRGPITDAKDQPATSNAAMYKYTTEAAKWETASRAATWGTRRRLSESEISSIVDGSQVRHLSLTKGRDRGNSILNKARGLLPHRSNSHAKREAEAPGSDVPATKSHHRQKSIEAIKHATRSTSVAKPRSPPLDTGSTFLAITRQLSGAGRSHAGTHEAAAAKSSGPLHSLRKHRSKSDVTRHAKSSTPGLAELMTKHGGPPIPTLASPMHERESILAAQVMDNEDAGGDDDDDDAADEVGIRMDLEIRAEDITPTVDGFRDHARRLNPRLEPYLIDRIGQEQIRRYKKLVQAKVTHTRTVQLTQSCPSAHFCFDLGGQAGALAARVSSRDPDATLTQFQVSNPGDHEIDETGFTEGVVTPALFPPGIPLPPVKRLPAEFECNICFKVKKFQKPSDWTKHVHEDVQPFSCTFPHCTESKSFKRKADWVRHENERHRHLEWWKCSMPECGHVCYRKDNFVQHLVREHKMSEPKVKGRGSGSSKHKPVHDGGWAADDSEVWRLVESCRLETQSKPRDEPCRFCGNVCSSFKKLSVHMGKHLEQIAMPVLELVDLRLVSADTIISPVDQPAAAMSSALGAVAVAAPAPITVGEPSVLSPYQTSGASGYQASSAGQSPSSAQGLGPNGALPLESAHGFYSPYSMTPTVQTQMVTGAFGGGGGSSFPHASPGMAASTVYGGTPHHERHLSPHSMSPQTHLVAPRSQPMGGSGYGPTFFDATGMDDGHGGGLHGLYPSTASAQAYMPTFAAALPPDVAHASASPLQSGRGSGLGFHAADPVYPYGIPGDLDGASNLHFQ